MAEERMTYFLIAMVAIVAVVGLVTMFMMSSGMTTPVTEQTALTGKSWFSIQYYCGRYAKLVSDWKGGKGVDASEMQRWEDLCYEALGMK